MIHPIPDEYDSKFRFILVAAKRAKQLQDGALPRLRCGSKKHSYIAIREAEAGLINWQVVEGPEDDNEE